MKIKNILKSYINNIKYIWKVHPKFGYFFENPFKIWFSKVIREYFILPSFKFNVHSLKYNDNFGNAIFGIYTSALSWKDKYGEPRYEDDPFIQLNLFGICFQLKFKCPFNNIATEEAYWESMLEYYRIIYKKEKPNLYKILNKNTWVDMNGNYFDNTLFLTLRGFMTYMNDRDIENK